MQQLKVGDKVIMTEERTFFPKGSIQVVHSINSLSSSCTYYLKRDGGDYFAPYNNTYRQYIPKNVIGGHLLAEDSLDKLGKMLKEDGTSDWLSSEGGKV